VIVFVDTSAFYAVFDADDENHLQARSEWDRLLGQEAGLLTSSYVLVETAALLQHRLGVPAVRAFHEDVCPLLAVDWVSQERHHAAMEALLVAGRKKLSLVDCTSFQIMRERAVQKAFCFDRHFREQGFEVLP
jgi:predicted nucleic acid-binding protein